MSCGAEHSVGLSDTGAVYAWGWGSYGNLGDGERVDRWAPVKVRLRPCLQALAHDTADLAPAASVVVCTLLLSCLCMHSQLWECSLSRSAPLRDRLQNILLLLLAGFMSAFASVSALSVISPHLRIGSCLTVAILPSRRLNIILVTEFA